MLKARFWSSFCVGWHPFGFLLDPFGSWWFFFAPFELLMVFSLFLIRFWFPNISKHFLEHLQQSTFRKYNAPWHSHPTLLTQPMLLRCRCGAYRTFSKPRGNRFTLKRRRSSSNVPEQIIILKACYVLEFYRIKIHTITHGASAPLNDDIVRLATSACKERPPQCMPTSFLRLLQTYHH